MTLLKRYEEALVEYEKATPEQRDAACKAQHLFNIAYHVDLHLALYAPDGFGEKERRRYANQIASSVNGDGVVSACVKWAEEIKFKSIRKAAKAEIVKTLELDMLEGDFSLTDTGNGERFAKKFYDKFKFLHDRDAWFHWDGKRWKKATKNDLHKAAKKVAKIIEKEMLTKSEEEKIRWEKWAKSSLSDRQMKNTISRALGEDPVYADMTNFDQHLHLLNVKNGTIDLRDGKLYPHQQENMLTTLTDIEYNPNAKCERWEQFIREIFDNDEGLINFVHRAVGYSLTGHTNEHAFFILHGAGRNGKGRFIKQLSALLGDCAKTTRFQTFTVNRDNESGNTPGLAALAWARLVTAGEPDQGVRLSESVIKMLTGEDEIMVCNKYEDPFNYTPKFKIWLHCNYKPQIRGTDTGIWSRPRLIPFNVSFITKEEAALNPSIDKDKRKDPDKFLDVTLDAEREGILAWAVRGAMKWFEQGLGRCDVVQQALVDYREESDELGNFIEECIKIAPGKFTPNGELYRVYGIWCERNIIDRPLKGHVLSKELVLRGFDKGKSSKDVRGFKNMTVKLPDVSREDVQGNQPQEGQKQTERPSA